MIDFQRHIVRRLFPALLCLWIGLSQAQTQAMHTVTDLAGRRVQLPTQIDRVLLGEGRLLPALGMLDRENPAQRLVAMMGDYETLDAPGYAQWQARFPQLDKVLRVGRTGSGSFSDEQAIAQRPQLAIFGLSGGHGPSKGDREIISRLEAAGVAVVFVDFRHDPLKNTPISMELLGQVLDRQARANAFASRWRQELARVHSALHTPDLVRPRVFLENRVGLADECCATMTGLVGKLLDAAGGANVAQGLIPGEHGTLNPELLLGQQPTYYIGTGIGHLAGAQRTPLRIVLGADATLEAARQSLRRAVDRPFIRQLQAVEQQRAFAVWHHFYNSPFNVVAIQAMARWLHPARTTHLDPQATLRELYEQFMPIPLSGVYWVSL